MQKYAKSFSKSHTFVGSDTYTGDGTNPGSYGSYPEGGSHDESLVTGKECDKPCEVTEICNDGQCVPRNPEEPAETSVAGEGDSPRQTVEGDGTSKTAEGEATSGTADEDSHDRTATDDSPPETSDAQKLTNDRTDADAAKHDADTVTAGEGCCVVILLGKPKLLKNNQVFTRHLENDRSNTRFLQGLLFKKITKL